jgi:hypothetical protein
MGRPRTPTNVLDAKGAFKRHADRKKARAGEPKVTAPLGEPPAGLTADQLACWKEIAEIAPPGVLTVVDRLAVEEAARILTKIRQGSVTTEERRLFLNYLGRFGMTPSDRSKVSSNIKPNAPGATGAAGGGDSKWGGIG